MPNFIQPIQREQPVGSLNKENLTGVEWLYSDIESSRRGQSEDWFTIAKKNGILILNPIVTWKNPLILAAIVLSCIVAFMFSCIF